MIHKLLYTAVFSAICVACVASVTLVAAVAAATVGAGLLLAAFLP